MLSASPAASNIDAGRIGFFGFSAGGSTGLDAPGFGRAAFHKEFNRAVLWFFRVNLGGT